MEIPGHRKNFENTKVSLGKSDLPGVARKMRRRVYPGKFRRGVKCAPALENPAPEPPAPLPPRIAAQGPRDRPRSAAAQLRRRDQPPQAGNVARISSAPAGQADRPAGRSARAGPPSPPAGDRPAVAPSPGEIGPWTGGAYIIYCAQNEQISKPIFVQHSVLI